MEQTIDDDEEDVLLDGEDAEDDENIGNDEADFTLCVSAASLNRFVRLLCPKCGEIFDDAPSWLCHLEDVHYYNNLKMLNIKPTQDGNEFVCKDCGQFNERTDYQLILHHCFTHMPYSNYFKCSICDQTTGEKQSVLQHIKRHYELHFLRAQTEYKAGSMVEARFEVVCNKETNYELCIKFSCPVCSTRMLNARQWVEHITEEHDLRCEARRNFQVVADLKQQKHQNSAYFCQVICKICGLQLHYNDDNFQLKHHLTHLRFRSFRCASCNLSLNYKSEIELHVRWMHALETKEKKNLKDTFGNDEEDEEDNKANCSTWLSKEKIRLAAKYSDYLLYFCPSCSVELQDYSHWIKHILSNHDFFRPRFLAMHYNVSKKGKTLQCLICDLRMSHYRNAFMRHYLIHMPYAPHACAICMYRSTNIYTLMKHLNRKHTMPNGEISELWNFSNKRT